MPKKVIPIKKITAWSFSRYSTYKTCPYKLKLTAIDKLKEPKNQAMERGAQIHELAEQYIKGKIARLPPELKLFEAEFKRLKAQFKKKISGMVVEDNWSFTKDWDETAWTTGSAAGFGSSWTAPTTRTKTRSSSPTGRPASSALR